MSQRTTERNNLPTWLWLAALTPMALCGVVLAALFSFNLVTLRQPTQQQALTRTRARLTSQALSLTSAARVKATDQVRQQTATAVAQIINEGGRYPILLSEAFDTNQRDWLNGTFSEGPGQAKLTAANGKYTWQLTSGSSSSFTQAAAINTSPTSKFYLSVEVKLLNLSHPLNGDYGLLFRKRGDSYYYFGIDGAQNYRFAIWQNNQWRFSVTKKNYSIRLNDVNRLIVIGDGPNYVFYINGQFADQFTDGQLSGTDMGLAAQLLWGGNNLLVEFDDFELRAPPDTGWPTSTPNPTNTFLPTTFGRTLTSIPTRTPTRFP